MGNIFVPKAGVDISHTARIKVYPDGSAQILCATAPVFRSEGWECVRDAPAHQGGAADTAANLARAQRRAKAAVEDIARANTFKAFVTLTLDQSRIDRYDGAAVIKRLNVWLDNQVRRRGLAYLLIPEHHKDGAIHFHGFINNALEMAFSGHYDRDGHEVFNLPQWRFGFSTAIRLYGDYRRAVGYVCKYVTKQREKIGGRWYYSGGALRRPDVLLVDLDIDQVEQMPGAFSFSPERSGVGYCRVDVENLGEILGNPP